MFSDDPITSVSLALTYSLPYTEHVVSLIAPKL